MVTTMSSTRHFPIGFVFEQVSIANIL